jgi:RNA polymerase sigma-70 factor, ECF subfamily
MKSKFCTFVNRYEDIIFSLALHILRNSSEAEDVTQEAFTKLWENIKRVESETAKQWLTTVTKNICIDRIRKRRNETQVDESHSTSEDKPSLEPVNALDQQQVSDWLMRAIDRLKEPYRSLIVLREIKQQGYTGIGQYLDLSESQVKVYLHRARQLLRDILQETRK